MTILLNNATRTPHKASTAQGPHAKAPAAVAGHAEGGLRNTLSGSMAFVLHKKACAQHLQASFRAEALLKDLG